MDLKRLFNKGKQVVDKRGGVDSLKEDAAELQDIAKGKGSLSDKARNAAAAIKDPGAPGGGAKPAGAGKPHRKPQGEGQHRPGPGPAKGGQKPPQP